MPLRIGGTGRAPQGAAVNGAELLAHYGLHGRSLAELALLLGHYLVLSAISVGGAITTAPDMHRFLVDQHGWIDDAQFNASIALAQAAPGPNILFVALMGWYTAGMAGLVAAMTGILLPASLLALAVGRWGLRRGDAPWARAFKAGMTPLTLGLLLATGWLLTAPTRHRPAALALVAATVWLSLRRKTSPLALMALGAAVGATGLV